MIRFLDAVGIKPRMVVDEFEENLIATHGRIAQEFMELSWSRTPDSDSSTVEQLYRKKNASLSLSLDVTSQYAGRQYLTLLTLVTHAFLPTKGPIEVLDIGCEGGIATCFYGQYFPKASVLGIDKCNECIVCARELAHKLGLQNVHFQQRNPFDGETLASDHSRFDLISMSLCGYEALSDQAVSELEIANTLLRLLKSQGQLFVVEPVDCISILAEIDEKCGGNGTFVNVEFESFSGSTSELIALIAQKPAEAVHL